MSEIHTQESPDVKPCAGEGCSQTLQGVFVGQLLHAWLNSFMETDRNCERIQGYFLGKSSWSTCLYSQKSYWSVVVQLSMVFFCICSYAYAMIFLTLSPICFIGVCEFDQRARWSVITVKQKRYFSLRFWNLKKIQSVCCCFFCLHACVH